MTEKEFLKHHSDYNGEQVDNLKQIVKDCYTGEELYEFVKFILKEQL